MKVTLRLLAVLLAIFGGPAIVPGGDPRSGLIDGTSLPRPPSGTGAEGSPPLGLGDDAPEWLRLNRSSPARFFVEPPGWAVRAGFLAFQRAGLDGNPLIQNAADQTTLFDTESYSFDWATGLDVGLSYRLATESFLDGWDVRFLGAEGATDTQSFSTPGPWTIPGDSTSWPQANFTARYDSRVSSGECNLQHDAESGCLTWLAGFRWLRLDDDLSTRASFSNADAFTLTTETSNNLWGGQVGLTLALSKVGTPLEIVARLKSGLYVSSSTATSLINLTSLTGGGHWSGRDDARQLAFVGDLEFNVVYHLSDRWSTYLAWQMLWLEGVAVAGAQPQAGRLLTGAPEFDLGNDAWFSGVIAGVRLRF